MLGFLQPFGPTPGNAAAVKAEDLYLRVVGEYRDLPGLTLTVRQAARLFCVDANRCKQVLAALVCDGLLVADGETFSRRDVDRRREPAHRV